MRWMPLLFQKYLLPNPILLHLWWSYISWANGYGVHFTSNMTWSIFFIRRQWTFMNPFYGELFLSVLSLLSYVAHQSFSLDCFIETSSLLKKCIRLLSTSGAVACTRCFSVFIPQHFNSWTRLVTSIINDHLHSLYPFLVNVMVPTLNLLLNPFDVELLFIETPSCLAWPVIL